jgi:hypothetical protein
MKQRWRKTIQIILLALFFLAPNFSSAQTASISVDRSVFNFEASPGENNTFKFNLKNDSSEPQKISITAKDYQIGDDDQVTISRDNSQISVAEWITLPEKDFALVPGEQREVAFSVQVPEEVSAGSHWGGIFINFTSANKKVEAVGTVVGGQIGIHVLANVSGQTDGKGKIASFAASRLVGKIADFSVVFQNTGNIHYIPHGDILITNLTNGQKEKIQLAKHFVFPGKKFTYVAQWRNPKLWGVYSAQTRFVDGEGNIQTQQRVMFGVLFFPMIVAFLAMLTIFGWILFKRRKKLAGKQAD